MLSKVYTEPWEAVSLRQFRASFALELAVPWRCKVRRPTLQERVTMGAEEVMAEVAACTGSAMHGLLSLPTTVP